MQNARSLSRLLAASRATLRQPKRRMSSGFSQEEEVKEMKKWQYVTIIAVPVCIGMAVYDLSGHHEHEEEQPAYSYLNIRSKTFPWGDCALFDGKCWEKQKQLAESGGEEE